jgi:chromosome partitioning protein
MEAARTGGVDYLFIDTAGRSDDSALSAARVADVVLVPSRPNIVEVETLPQVNDLLRLAGSPPAFVLLNGIHPNAGRSTLEEVRQGLHEMFGLVVCPVYLCQRNVYAEAMTTGRVPQELETDGRAADELNRLFKFISGIINAKDEENNGGQVRRNSRTA